MIRVLFLYFVPFFGLCYTESDALVYDMKLRPLHLGGRSYETKREDIIKAFVNKPLHIIVGQHEFGYISCYATKQKNSRFEVEHECDEKDYYIIKVTEVTNEMSTKWWCDIKDYYSSTPFNLIFTVHVIGAVLPTLTIGNTNIPVTLTNTTKTDYDGIAYYSYRDGDPLDFQCECPNTKVSISYYDTQVTSYQNSVPDVAKFAKQLSTDDNGHEIDCTISTDINTYMYRIILQLYQPESLTSPAKKNTAIAMYSVGGFVLALFILAVYLFWRQKTPKETKGDKVDLVSVSSTTRRNSKITDIAHEIHNNDLYAISLKTLEQKKTLDDGPVYSEPKPIN